MAILKTQRVITLKKKEFGNRRIEGNTLEKRKNSSFVKYDFIKRKYNSFTSFTNFVITNYFFENLEVFRTLNREGFATFFSFRSMVTSILDIYKKKGYNIPKNISLKNPRKHISSKTYTLIGRIITLLEKDFYSKIGGTILLSSTTLVLSSLSILKLLSSRNYIENPLFDFFLTIEQKLASIPNSLSGLFHSSLQQNIKRNRILTYTIIITPFLLFQKNNPKAKIPILFFIIISHEILIKTDREQFLKILTKKKEGIGFSITCNSDNASKKVNYLKRLWPIYKIELQEIQEKEKKKITINVIGENNEEKGFLKCLFSLLINLFSISFSFIKGLFELIRCYQIKTFKMLVERELPLAGLIFKILKIYFIHYAFSRSILELICNKDIKATLLVILLKTVFSTVNRDALVAEEIGALYWPEVKNKLEIIIQITLLYIVIELVKGNSTDNLNENKTFFQSGILEESICIYVLYLRLIKDIKEININEEFKGIPHYFRTTGEYYRLIVKVFLDQTAISYFLDYIMIPINQIRLHNILNILQIHKIIFEPLYIIEDLITIKKPASKILDKLFLSTLFSNVKLKDLCSFFIVIFLFADGYIGYKKNRTTEVELNNYQITRIRNKQRLKSLTTLLSLVSFMGITL